MGPERKECFQERRAQQGKSFTVATDKKKEK